MDNKLSLTSLLNNLIEGLNKQPKFEAQDNEKKVGTTIRLEPNVRKFVDFNAEKLGISTQDFIALTLRSVMQASVEPQATPLELMLSRFFEVFKSHDIPIADIPKLFAKGKLAKSDFLSKETLLDRIDDEIIDQTCQLFCIEPLWLKGEDEYAHSSRNRSWYKTPENIARKISTLSHLGSQVEVLFVTKEGTDLRDLKEASQNEDNLSERNVCVVLRIRKSVNKVIFTSFELWEYQRWNYEPCRTNLKSIMLFLEKTNIRFYGNHLPKDEFEQLCAGKALASNILKSPQIWHLEELLWEDEQRNPEFNELSFVKSHYNSKTHLSSYEVAIIEPYKVTNWEKVADGLQSPKTGEQF